MESLRPDESAQQTLRYHPSFNSPEARVVLRSREGMQFRVPSFTLRNTTEFFRDSHMIPHNVDPQQADVLIPVNEKDSVLERFLRMLCGLSTPRWQSYEEVEEVSRLAEEWKAPGPLAMIRSAITAPVFLSEPLRLYVIACRMGWVEEARLASKHTLGLSLFDPEYQQTLEQLPASNLLALLSLHRRRRDEFKNMLDSDSIFDAGNSQPRFCNGCGDEVDNHTWRELKIRMYVEMDQRPLGDIVGSLELEEWSEATACWTAKCKKSGCGRLNYERLATLKAIKGCIEKLPVSI